MIPNNSSEAVNRRRLEKTMAIKKTKRSMVNKKLLEISLLSHTNLTRIVGGLGCSEGYEYPVSLVAPDVLLLLTFQSMISYERGEE